MPVSLTTVDQLRTQLKKELLQQLGDQHVTFSVSVMDDVNVRTLSVRKALTIGDVVHFLVEHEFSSKSAEKGYRLYTSQGQPLNDDDPVATITGTTVSLRREGERPVLILATLEGKTFPIFQFPAIIGRYDRTAPDANLTVDLTGLEDSRTVSRRHARITLQDETLYLENISKSNFVTINQNKPVASGEALAFTVGDKLQLGTIVLTSAAPEVVS